MGKTTRCLGFRGKKSRKDYPGKDVKGCCLYELRPSIRRPFSIRSKCYGFDTGFVTFIKGWDTIREEDRGLLWEHLTLDTLRTRVNPSNLYYWRDKSGREIDFIVRKQGRQVHAIECKINPDHFEPKSFIAFRTLYPEGENHIVSPVIKVPYRRRHNEMVFKYSSLIHLHLT